MPDDEAFMALVLCNTHRELAPLERGMHALKSGMTQRAYAEKVGRASTSVQNEMQAAKVMMSCTDIGAKLSPHSLTAIHAAPSWLWPALVSAAHKNGWTVEAVRSQVSRVKEVVTPPDWSDIPAIAAAVVDGSLKPKDVAAIGQVDADGIATLVKRNWKVEAYKAAFLAALKKARPASLSAAMQAAREVLDAQDAEAHQIQHSVVFEAAFNSSLTDTHV